MSWLPYGPARSRTVSSSRFAISPGFRRRWRKTVQASGSTVFLALALGLGCSGPSEPPDDPDGLVALDPVAHLVRASMAVRGTRPTLRELDQVAMDPDALPGLVDGWLESDEFGATVRDMWAEVLLLRNDTFNQLPALGELNGYELDAIYQGTVEEPLRLVEHIVLEDRPFTDIVTADYMLTDDVTARIYGVPYDFAAGGWQVSEWPDARPKAGLLSSAQVWRRWESDGSNFNRGRANMVAGRLLCEDFESRDILVEGGIDIADELAVAHAVRTQPGCVSCHQSLDPLAGYFWGYKRLVHRNYVADSITGGCDFNWANGNQPEFGPSYLPEDYCYPIKQYNPADEDDWAEWDLRPPNFYGIEARDLAEVGRIIADDPRFSQCVARQFYGYFTETPADEVPFEVATEMQVLFEDSGFSAKELVRAIVLDARFAAITARTDDPVAGLHTIRPEQYARTIEDLTGYRWWSMPDPPGCADPLDPDVARFGSQCWGPVDLSTSDVFGYRSMSGGVDGKVILRPTHSPTPTKTLAMSTLAADAAGTVVDADFTEPLGSRHLLDNVDAQTIDELSIRAELALVYTRVLGIRVGPSSPEVDELWALFKVGLNTRGDATGAWKLVLTALFQDPRMMFW